LLDVITGTQGAAVRCISFKPDSGFMPTFFHSFLFVFFILSYINGKIKMFVDPFAFLFIYSNQAILTEA